MNIFAFSLYVIYKEKIYWQVYIGCKPNVPEATTVFPTGQMHCALLEPLVGSQTGFN
jgi:hypothetical protein